MATATRPVTPVASRSSNARISRLRESIARRALTVMGVPVDACILDVQRVGTVFIVASEEPGNRWSRYHVDAFRIPTADDTDPECDEGMAPKVWGVLAGWGGDDLDGVPALLAKARVYADSVQDLTGPAVRA
ncbi:hypothetical protein ACIQPQ_31370 [Streptomyces sp. NPDC091281]|uniref:hypothetical protein n=1 Tax=Streptomyces sp. NPDC091281 TaxID=3365985 RepID=UPI00382EEA32